MEVGGPAPYLDSAIEPVPVHLCFFEDANAAHLSPLVLVRTAGDLRVGAQTLIEAQVAAFPDVQRVIVWTRPEVADVTRQEHPAVLVNEVPDDASGLLLVNQRWLVREGDFVETIREAARPGEPAGAWKQGETLVAAWLPDQPMASIDRMMEEMLAVAEPIQGETIITNLWDLIVDVPERTAYGIKQLGHLGEHRGSVQTGAHLVYPENIHIAQGGVIRPGSVLNAEEGPIHIGAGATVEENAVVRGPVFLGAKSHIKAGARIDGSAIGPGCKVAGEVHENILHSYSSKAHDGYMGNSYVGSWCNLGAGTNTSNLKNDYGAVSVYDAVAKAFIASGRQFVGLFIGDHSKCAINTMFNTGTVVGVFCNVFGSGFPPRHIPSFSWGSPGIAYELDHALRVAEAVMARRGVVLTEADRNLLASVFEQSR